MILSTICFIVGLLLGFLAAAILSGSRNAATARELHKLKDAALFLPTIKRTRSR